MKNTTNERYGLWRIADRKGDQEDTLYWSNQKGWVGIAQSDGFSNEEKNILNLPIGGQWWFDEDQDDE